MTMTTVLQTRLGHTFKDAALLQQALTHRSYGSMHNERLEFLGDAILNCVIATLLFNQYGAMSEGDLSRLRANLVNRQTLYEIAQRLELASFLRLGEGELKAGGFNRPSILADATEALLGAVYLDAGFDATQAVIHALYQPLLYATDAKTRGKDPKTLLQEYLQGKKIPLPHYNVVKIHGAAHNQTFEVECVVPKFGITQRGMGESRRAAEQVAARRVLEAIELAANKEAANPKSPAKHTFRTFRAKMT